MGIGIFYPIPFRFGGGETRARGEQSESGEPSLKQLVCTGDARHLSGETNTSGLQVIWKE
jgi:hypothetical protein